MRLIITLIYKINIMNHSQRSVEIFHQNNITGTAAPVNAEGLSGDRHAHGHMQTIKDATANQLTREQQNKSQR